MQEGSAQESVLGTEGVFCDPPPHLSLPLVLLSFKDSQTRVSAAMAGGPRTPF